jgi:hypothetical protein
MIERRVPMATDDDLGDDGRMKAEMDRRADEGVAPGRRAPRERMTRERGAPPAVDEADGVLDELQAWYLGKAEREGWVYTGALRQLVNRMYRDRDYLARRSNQGKRTAYDYAVERDQVALSWAIRMVVRHVPLEEKRKAEPPKKPRRPSRHLSERERAIYAGKPSWNGKPMRGWDGLELPPPNL